MAYSLEKYTVSSTGAITYQSTAISSALLLINGRTATMFGGNDTPRLLMSVYNSSTQGNDYELLDTATATSVTVTGIDPSIGNLYWGDLVAVTRGSTYLVLHAATTANNNNLFRYQRYSITAAGAAVPEGALMTIPQFDSVDAFDYYDDPTAGDVWDEGTFVAVGLMVWIDSTQTAQLYLAIFDGTTSAPQHMIELYSDPTAFLWQSGPTTITFSKVGNDYWVTYVRLSARPIVGSPRSYTDYYTYVRRTINPVTGALGPEIFVSDTSSEAGFDGMDFIRADNGSTLAYISHEVANTYESSKLSILNCSGTTEGGVDLYGWNDWNTYDQAYTWIGLDLGGTGPLHFKYRWP